MLVKTRVNRILTVFLSFSLIHAPGLADSGTVEPLRGGESDTERERESSTLQPNLRLLQLHSALLTKSFQGDQQFFRETSTREGSHQHLVSTATSLKQRAYSRNMEAPTIPTVPTGPARNTVTTAKALSQQKDMRRTGTKALTLSPPGHCDMNFTAAEGWIQIPQEATVHSHTSCTYWLTVSPGYGVQIQVVNVSLEATAQVKLEDTGGPEPIVLADRSVLSSGLMLWSSSNQVSVVFSSGLRAGSFLLHYSVFPLSCSPPPAPDFGEVSVTSLTVGGIARFTCLKGHHLQGSSSLTCRNASTPDWSGRAPTCPVVCGRKLRNATRGRITSPGFPANYSNNLTCHWTLEAPEGHRLHVHFEKVSLAEDDDRLLIKDGDSFDSPPLYDSYTTELHPAEGVTSSGRDMFLELSTDETGTDTGFAIHYETFGPERCYEPLVSHGNVTSSDSGFALGSVVRISCYPGYTLESGASVLQCVDPQKPRWNETEAACTAICGGDVTDSAGSILSPHWPEPYDRGQDCIWGLHVEEDHRLVLDVQVLRLGDNDLLTVYDGEDLSANILGQYSGSLAPFKLFTSSSDVTVQFQSDPALVASRHDLGFVLRFHEVARNDTCAELPEVSRGWKSTSQTQPVRGTVVTFQCYPGHRLLGPEVLVCQWDLTWSGEVPSCERIMFCEDPGLLENGRRHLSSSDYAVGSTVEYVCNKGYVLSGPAVLRCCSRDTAAPKWSETRPKCFAERYEPCSNPGAPSTAVQSSEKAFYHAGETLSFTCRTGYVLQGAPTVRCLPGHPSRWSAAPPMCRATSGNNSEHRLNAADADFGVEAVNTAIAVLVPVTVLLLLLLLLIFCVSVARNQQLRLPGSTRSPPYNTMTEESAFESDEGLDSETLRDVDSHNTIVLS